MKTEPSGESFAALFERTSDAAPRRRLPRVGEALEATVVQIGKEAVFVELDDHRQGVVDAADLRDPAGASVVAVGDKLRLRVVAMDAEQGVRLVPTREAAAAAGAGVRVGSDAQADAVRIAVGQAISGTVSRVESYGIFIQIDGTQGRAGRGLLPTVETGLPRGADLRKAFPVGAPCRAKVLELGDGKIRLSIRALKDDEERAQFEGFRDGERAGAQPGFGTLGDLMKRRRG